MLLYYNPLSQKIKHIQGLLLPFHAELSYTSLFHISCRSLCAARLFRALPHQYMQGLLEAETINRREEEIQRRFHDISNREEASKERFLIEVGCEDTDLRLDLYVDLMLTNVAKYVSRLEKGMSQKSIPVNMLKAAVVTR